VILEPAAVVDLLDFLFVYGFNGRAVEEGRSFARLGEAQFDRAISIRDDVTDPAQVGVAFDAEGTPKRRVDVVHNGVTGAVLQTRRTAAKAGTKSTGSAVPGAEGWGALPANVVLEAGERSIDELLAGVGRGLLVTEFHYTRILDPRTTVVTGLIRNGVWLIEDGRIARPVRNLRFTQSYAEALAPGAVLGVGRDRSLVPGEWDVGGSLVPALHLASWNFTGGARG
jgi:predicted Zn-dependent protease